MSEEMKCQLCHSLKLKILYDGGGIEFINCDDCGNTVYISGESKKEAHERIFGKEQCKE